MCFFLIVEAIKISIVRNSFTSFLFLRRVLLQLGITSLVVETKSLSFQSNYFKGLNSRPFLQYTYICTYIRAQAFLY